MSPKNNLESQKTPHMSQREPFLYQCYGGQVDYVGRAQVPLQGPQSKVRS